MASAASVSSGWWRTAFAAALLSGVWPLRGVAQSGDDLETLFRRQTDATLGTIVREGRSSFGAALLVEAGRVAASSTFGVEDPTTRSPISIDVTLIDLNSLRKLFIAVAVAQLIDRGMIAGVDDPVNLYLRHYKLPKRLGREVTIRELATHTAGFDQVEFGAGTLDADPVRFFERRFPGYVDHPDSLSAYDSYGPKLLAYMVSEITDRPFSRYVEEYILGPLGMKDTHLTAVAKPPAHRIVAFQPARRAAIQPGDELRSVQASLVDGPAVSTFGDIAKFMIALLGPAPDQRVITPRMREVMFRIQQSNGEGGSAHGLIFDAVRAGTKTLYVHGGVGLGTKCMLALDVARTAGVFYCYGDVVKRFDFHPGPLAPPFEQMTDSMLEPLLACPGQAGGCSGPAGSTWNESWNRYLGTYVDRARHHRGFSRLDSLIHPALAVVEKSDATLRLDGVDGFVEVAPGAFASPHHLATVCFIVDGATGRIMMSVSDRPSVYDRAASLWENPRLIRGGLALLVLIAMSGGLFVLLPGYRLERFAAAAAASYGAVVGAAVICLYGFSAFGRRYFDGISWPLDGVRTFAFLIIPAAVFLLVDVPRLNRMRHEGIARLAVWHYDAIAVSSLIMVALLLGIEVISFSPIT